MDAVAKMFEIGTNAGGTAQVQAFIAAQVAAGYVNHIDTTPFQSHDSTYRLVIMAKTAQRSLGTGMGSYVLAAQFPKLQNDPTALLNFINNAVNGVAAPSSPVLSLVAGGTLTGQGTLSVKITLVTAGGETAASTNTTLAVTDNHELVVASPISDTAKQAIGWNVYIGAAGSEKKQNTAALTLGTAYTLTTAPSTTGALASSTNATVAKYVRSLSISLRFQDHVADIVMSN